MKQLPDDAGNQDKKHHSFIWPLGQYKGRRLVSVPLDYLRRFVQKAPKKNEQRLYNLAKAEVDRRGFSDDHIHVTEHAVERFTARWADEVVHYQKHTGKKPVGAISIIKHLFKKALKRGETTKAEGNKGNNFKVTLGQFQWMYGQYQQKDHIDYKIISVMPAKKK